MILIKVAYDAYNQQFRLVEPTQARMFDDGEEYVVAVDFFPSDWDTGELPISAAEIGHA
jgi:hypothetical protein